MRYFIMATQTTLKISGEVLDKLRNLKIHPNQSYDELIKTLIIHGKHTGFKPLFIQGVQNA